MVKSVNMRENKEFSENGLFFDEDLSSYEDMKPTFKHIAWKMVNDYNLPVPNFWMENFPAEEFLKNKKNKSRKVQ